MTTTRRSRMITKVVAGAAGLGLAAVAVLGFSNAAFHAETDNAGNNWATEGFVSLTDDHEAPLFSVGLGDAGKPYTGTYDAPLVPGGAGIADRTTTITFDGNVNADVRLFVAPGYRATPDSGIEDTYITVQRDGEEVYSGLLEVMPNSYAAATGNPWIVDGPDEAVYTFSISVPNYVEEGATIEDVRFIWAAEPAA